MSESMVEMTEADARELEFYRRSDAIQSERAKNKRSGAQLYAAVKRAISNNPDCFEELLDRARAARDQGAPFSVPTALAVMRYEGFDTRLYAGLVAFIGRELILADRSLAGTVLIRRGPVVSPMYPELADCELTGTVDFEDN